ncbi:nucleotidyl transferase AbiEii/AbiGii toxin family protein [uncultured Porphyromonas sp.]|uniref:nucleotidyl transferase AbiEii/AbiGii toxin family protein n=1 Tax=uncultured Porphyromonas sp. TaxID=159274 RepID=UPI00262867E9|nr:nucleotidyl transferase AbiEii/AbiGii toxin family protein [uncultured Porphyromonas sp.]
MLQTTTVEKRTLELLKQLQSQSEFSNFHLAGGTALALYLGHRKSIDLDLFTPYPFNTTRLEHSLVTKFGFQGDYSEQNTLKGRIDGIKIDCITHPYPLLRTPLDEEGVRLYSEPDIIAMKLSAIADNGSRLKDFIDIAYLSTRYSFQEMLGFYVQKFPTSSPLRPLKGITYFDDIDHEETVVMLEGTYSWQKIADRLQAMTAHQSKVFASPPLFPARKSSEIIVPSSPVQAQAQAILDAKKGKGQGSPALKTEQEVQADSKSYRHKR